MSTYMVPGSPEDCCNGALMLATPPYRTEALEDISCSTKDVIDLKADDDDDDDDGSSSPPPPLCGSDDEGPARAATRKARPCLHNQWLKYGKKQGKIVLRCTEASCKRQWKIKPGVQLKCDDFYKGGCTRGVDCSHPHIYARQGYLRTVTTPIEGLARRTDWPPLPNALTSFPPSAPPSMPPSNPATPSPCVARSSPGLMGSMPGLLEAGAAAPIKPLLPPTKRRAGPAKGVQKHQQVQQQTQQQTQLQQTQISQHGLQQQVPDSPAAARQDVFVDPQWQQQVGPFVGGLMVQQVQPQPIPLSPPTAVQAFSTAQQGLAWSPTPVVVFAMPTAAACYSPS
eukprot:Hpha_TRINITY_DN16859_c2_g6::TRINITY_DN16859_c2_g6_i1::g.152577::m.152577